MFHRWMKASFDIIFKIYILYAGFLYVTWLLFIPMGSLPLHLINSEDRIIKRWKIIYTKFMHFWFLDYLVGPVILYPHLFSFKNRDMFFGDFWAKIQIDMIRGRGYCSWLNCLGLIVPCGHIMPNIREQFSITKASLFTMF